MFPAVDSRRANVSRARAATRAASLFSGYVITIPRVVITLARNAKSWDGSSVCITRDPHVLSGPGRSRRGLDRMSVRPQSYNPYAICITQPMTYIACERGREQERRYSGGRAIEPRDPKSVFTIRGGYKEYKKLTRDNALSVHAQDALSS